MNYDILMEKARKTNKERSELEQEEGFATPEGMEVWQHIRTAMSAIEAGIRTDDWNAVAEGQAMLEIVIKDVAFIEEGILKKLLYEVGGCVAHTEDYHGFWFEWIRDAYKDECLAKVVEIGRASLELRLDQRGEED